MSGLQSRLADALADRYRVERTLGAGGMATVFLAHDLKHDRQVAIKVLRRDLGESLGPDRFLQEIRVAAKLQHPHIVAVLDSGVIPGNTEQAAAPYYVMPYVAGETLRDRLARSGAFSIDETVRFTSEIADALAKAHNAGVVHRDIKPENILLADGHAQVMDFGVAKALSNASEHGGLTSVGISLGTPAYMAPEQVAADPNVDHRADIYALGLVAYEMLAGGAPYAATTPQQQMAAHVTQPAVPVATKRADCPPALASLVMRCLEKSPGDRWQSAEDIVAQLARPDMRTTRAGNRSGTRNSGFKVAVAAALLLAALAIWQRFGGNASVNSSAAIAATDNTVGVMLFKNITNDSSLAYLSDGLASEIATSLARVPRLEVRSPGAVRSAQRGIEPDPREVGRILDVRNIVEGEFQHGGDKMRITVRLVSVPSGTQRWTSSWTRSSTDLLAVQEEVAAAVATAISGELLPQERTVLATRTTENPVAYDHFMRGNFQLAKRNVVSSRQAISEFTAAVRLDSTFVQAESKLALAYALHAEWGWEFPGVSRDSLLTLGFRAVDHALAQDSMVADGWTARGYLLSLRDPRTVAGAQAALERATALEPQNAEAWQQLGSVLFVVGQTAAAAVAYERAIAIEPGRPISLTNLANLYEILGRDREAMAIYDKAIAVDPEFYYGLSWRALLRLRLGDIPGAHADADAAFNRSPSGERYYGLSAQAAVAAANGDTASARMLARQAVAFFDQRTIGPLAGSIIISGLVSTGLTNDASALLERVRPRGALLYALMHFASIRPSFLTEPRVKRVLDEIRPPGVVIR